MVYLNADNNLEKYGVYDFLEMARIGSTDDVNIVVQLDRSPKYSELRGNWSSTKRFLIRKHDEPISAAAISDIGEADMGSGQTLEEFVEWTRDSYPAEHYALIIWDHGDGWRDPGDIDVRPFITKAVSHDESSGDLLFNREIQNSLARVMNESKIDIIGFDACLMATLENAYAMSHVAKIMVASEELVPGTGWDYERVLAKLVANPEDVTTRIFKAHRSGLCRLIRSTLGNDVVGL